MNRSEIRIPNHDREAVSEALEAALYCAAFQRLEEKEMKEMLHNIKRAEERPELARAVRRRLSRRRGISALRRALPRAVQVAAAIIAVVSVGTGIALAASPAARQWAAGALYSRVTDPDGWFGEVRSSLTDGAAVGGRLMVVEDNAAISVYAGTEAEPETYAWRDAGNRRIVALTADGEDVWAVYSVWEGEPQTGFALEAAPRGYGVGQVRFGEDGTFDVDPMAEAPISALFDPEGRPLESYGIQYLTPCAGELYFLAHYDLKEEAEKGFSFAPEHLRLLRWRPSDGALSEIDLSGVAFDWISELFGGNGAIYLASADDGAAAVRVYRLESGALTPVCQVPNNGVVRAECFALRESDGALVYVQDGSVYVAPGMEPSRAVRAALCGDIGGRALMLDETTFAVVGGGSVEVFDLSAPLGEVNELVVDGVSWNSTASERFAAEHPDIAIVRNSGMNYDKYESYDAMMLAGVSGGDVVALDQDGFKRVRDAGLVAPLTDPALIAEWRLMPERLREFLSVNGQPAAIPMSFYAYTDVMFQAESWEAVRGSLEDYPDTWLDYANWLAEFSHSDAAKRYVIQFDGYDRLGLARPELFRMYTLWQMADAFARCWDALGEQIDFGRAEFAECVAALERVDWRALSYDPDYESDDRRALSFVGAYDPLFSEDDWTAGCRTLRIREDAPRLSRASGDFAFVTATSTSKASAQEYLKTLAAVNHTSGDGYLDERMCYDFVTDPEVLAKEVGELVTADSIRRYRAQVGEPAFRAEPGREELLAIRDATIRYVSGETGGKEWVETLNGLFR